MNTYTSTPEITNAELLQTFGQFATIAKRYALQRIANGFRTLCHTCKSCAHWLNTRHDYSNEEGEIILTGWQYLGISFAVLLFALLASIAA